MLYKEFHIIVPWKDEQINVFSQAAQEFHKDVSKH